MSKVKVSEIKLSEDLEYWRDKSPDEWIMDRFINKAKKLEGRVSSECNTLLSDDNPNEFKITVSCKYEIYRSEWLELLMILNETLQTHADGKFSNVTANLEEIR